MRIKLSKEEAIEILTDLFFEVANNGLALGQGKISVGIDIKDNPDELEMKKSMCTKSQVENLSSAELREMYRDIITEMTKRDYC